MRYLNLYIQLIVTFALAYTACTILTGCQTITPGEAYRVITGGG